MNKDEVITLAAGLIVQLAKLITDTHAGATPSAEVLATLQAANAGMAADRKAVDDEIAALKAKLGEGA